MPVTSFDEIRSRIGKEIGVSGWLTIDQKRIDEFAESTEDRQFIHVDPQAAAQTPFGTTIAHGFLTLSLLPEMSASAFELRDTRMGVNYGLNRVRFISPVKVGARVRMRTKLAAVDEVGPGAYQVTNVQTIEIEGGERPAMVAESLVRFYF